ncbi:uncharacterized protein LOC131949625 [Physella acuta]|uniref:uncharacterized protein LOC131949625 n=1 Tax=Physella acuta TaxID=109671 RepID=UPI0027DC83C5|nr:uncharacterized protein LOC131949625 [Physella acuta]
MEKTACVILVLALNIGLTIGLQHWVFNSPSAEPRELVMDPQGYNKISYVFDYATAGYTIKFRVNPKDNTIDYVESGLNENVQGIKSCLPKEESDIACTNFTSPDSPCTVGISLPCIPELGGSRWDTTLLFDITVVKGERMMLTECFAVCLVMGYSERDKYQGGNGVAEWQIGLIIAAVVLVCAGLLLGLVMWKMCGDRNRTGYIEKGYAF